MRSASTRAPNAAAVSQAFAGGSRSGGYAASSSRHEAGSARWRRRATRAVAELRDPAIVVLDVEDPLADPVVEVVASARLAHLGPEVHVLAVGLGRGEATVEPTGVRAHRAHRHRQHAVRRQAHEVGPRADVVDHLLDGHDGTPPRGQRAPHAFEQRRVEGDVAVAVGDRAVDERHVGCVRLEQADRAERRVDRRVAGVLRHRAAGQRGRGDGREAAGGGLEALLEGEERPVLHLHRAAAGTPARRSGWG